MNKTQARGLSPLYPAATVRSDKRLVSIAERHRISVILSFHWSQLTTVVICLADV